MNIHHIRLVVFLLGFQIGDQMIESNIRMVDKNFFIDSGPIADWSQSAF